MHVCCCDNRIIWQKKYLENLCFVYLTTKVGKPIDQIVNITLYDFSLAIHWWFVIFTKCPPVKYSCNMVIWLALNSYLYSSWSIYSCNCKSLWDSYHCMNSQWREPIYLWKLFTFSSSLILQSSILLVTWKSSFVCYHKHFFN